MTSQPGKQTIAMQTFPNIYRSKGNQTSKFGHLMRNNFIEKSYIKCGGEAISRNLSKK